MTDQERSGDDAGEPTLEFFESAAEPTESVESPDSTPHRLLRSRGVVATSLVAMGVASGIAIGAGLPRHSSTTTTSSAPPSTPTFPYPMGSSNSTTSDGPTDAAAIARDVDPGVVDITTTMANGEAAGTGMALTSDGIVLTNNHVIDGATSISVRDVGNDQTYQATVLGYDRSEDIAVLQLQGASGLATVKTATAQPSVGAAVVGIGNAEGTGGTPSYAGGAITGTNRSITANDQYDGTSERLTGLIATDADIQSGDSGGPLVNASGEVIGMDTAATANESFSGVGGDGFGSDGFSNDGSGVSRGFAIPIAAALAVADQIEAGHSSSTVHIGPTAQLGVYISGREQSANGVAVEQVQTGGPADNAGITAGDLITSVNGTSVTSPNSLEDVMATLAPGQKIPVAYESAAGTSHTVTVTVNEGAPQ